MHITCSKRELHQVLKLVQHATTTNSTLPILGSVLSLLGNVSKGVLGDFLKAIPNYFIGTNFGALLNDQGQYLAFGGSSTPAVSVVHAVIVLLVYFAFFIGLTWWINKRRDVTN